jgi:hypothetical protein
VPQDYLRSKVNGTIFHSLFRYLYFSQWGLQNYTSETFSVTHFSVNMYLFNLTFNCLFC